MATAEEKGRVQGVADLATTSLFWHPMVVYIANLVGIFLFWLAVPVVILAFGLGWLGFIDGIFRCARKVFALSQ